MQLPVVRSCSLDCWTCQLALWRMCSGVLQWRACAGLTARMTEDSCHYCRMLPYVLSFSQCDPALRQGQDVGHMAPWKNFFLLQPSLQSLKQRTSRPSCVHVSRRGSFHLNRMKVILTALLITIIDIKVNFIVVHLLINVVTSAAGLFDCLKYLILNYLQTSTATANSIDVNCSHFFVLFLLAAARVQYAYSMFSSLKSR
ncbi:hypothetical protein STEG23_025544 [Scotinomys teguina]